MLKKQGIKKQLTSKHEPISYAFNFTFFPEFPIIFTHYSLFIPMLSSIILYYSSNLIVSLVKLHMAADKIVYFSVIDNNSSYEVALLLSYSSD